MSSESVKCLDSASASNELRDIFERGSTKRSEFAVKQRSKKPLPSIHNHRTPEVRRWIRENELRMNQSPPWRGDPKAI